MINLIDILQLEMLSNATHPVSFPSESWDTVENLPAEHMVSEQESRET